MDQISALDHERGSDLVREPTTVRKSGWLNLAFGIALIYLAFLPPGVYSVDGNAMLAVAESLVANHSLAVPSELGVPGRGGQFFSKWYPLQSLVAVPFVALGIQAAHVLHLPPHYLAALCALVLPVAFTAATTALVALISLELGSSKRGAFFAAIAYAFGTIAMAYARSFYAEPLLALLTAGGIYFTIASASPLQISAAALLAALAVLAKPTGIVVGPLLSAYLLLKGKPIRLSLAPSAGALLGLVLYLGYNQFRFGHPLMFGQAWAFSFSGMLQGIAGLLVSPGRGLIWYSPPILLGVLTFKKARKSNRLGKMLVMAIFLAFLILHALWSAWPGGWSWGPRFLLPAIPGMAALLGTLEGNLRRVVAALVIIGFLINAPTLFAFYERYYAEANEQGISEHELLWSFSRAPFLHAWPAAYREVRDARGADVRELLSERGAAPASNIASSRALRIVALWWWMLPIAGIPRAAGACLSFLMVAAGCVLLWRQFRATATPT